MELFRESIWHRPYHTIIDSLNSSRLLSIHISTTDEFGFVALVDRAAFSVSSLSCLPPSAWAGKLPMGRRGDTAAGLSADSAKCYQSCPSDWYVSQGFFLWLYMLSRYHPSVYMYIEDSPTYLYSLETHLLTYFIKYQSSCHGRMDSTKDGYWLAKQHKNKW